MFEDAGYTGPILEAKIAAYYSGLEKLKEMLHQRRTDPHSKKNRAKHGRPKS